MRRTLRRFGSLIAQTVDKCARDNTAFMAGSISFYSMLSLTPALWVVIAVAGSLVGQESARSAVMDWVSQNIGYLGARYLETAIDQVNESSRLATIGGAVAMFMGATAAFAALRNSLAVVWNLPSTETPGFWASLGAFAKNFFTTRLLAVAAMLVFGVLLVCSLFIGALLEFLERYVPAALPAPGLILDLAHFLVSYVFMMLMFAAVYHLLHRQSFDRSEIWVGAGVTAFLFAIGNSLIGPYLGGAAVRSAYGAAGAFVLLLLWVYYSAQIFLFGAAFTEVYARSSKSPPASSPNIPLP